MSTKKDSKNLKLSREDREALGKQIIADSIALNPKVLFHKMSLTHDFEKCLRDAEKGYIVSFFVEEVSLLSRKTALSENIHLQSDAPYVLLKNGLSIPVTDAKDLERKVTLIDLGGTASDIDLISIPITLKDDEFAQFIQTLNTDKDRNRTWEEFFKKYGDPKDLEDFMADREQDVPKDKF